MESIEFTRPEKDKLLNGIVRYAGITDRSYEDSRILKTAKGAAEKALALIRPLSIIKKTPFKGIDMDILKGEAISIQSTNLCMLASHMNTPSFIYGFALTLGEGFDMAVSAAQQKSFTEAFFLDTAGAFLAEYYASLIEGHLRIDLSENGFKISSRFSPGYCDWEAGAGQKELFSFLNPEKIGLNLLDSFMMSPMKSITGIIIAARMFDYETPCVFCLKELCLHRRHHP